VNTYGRIDTWVNNAGVLVVGEFEKIDEAEAHRVFNVNFWGEYHGCKAVLPIMRGQGSGTIVNVTSVTARRPLPLMSVYSASKAAINGLSEAIRAELKGSGIELCIVMPATIDTPLYQHSRSKEGLAAKPAPPIYPPSEVARAIELAATSPKRDIYAGPAGFLFNITNSIAPGLLDKALGTVGYEAILTDKPEPPYGADNLDKPMSNGTYNRASGGWRTGRYKAAETASRIALGLGALLLARRLVRR
jgi:short-subunit dehydrogenase